MTLLSDIKNAKDEATRVFADSPCGLSFGVEGSSAVPMLVVHVQKGAISEAISVLEASSMCDTLRHVPIIFRHVGLAGAGLK